MSIQYEFSVRPANGQSLNVTPGVEWLRMPLPFSLNHINLWLLRDDDCWAIVDTGVGNRETQDLWRGVFSQTMRGDAASRVIATHMHPDHVGCAGFLTQHFKSDFCMSREEYTMCRILVADTGRAAAEEGISFYKDAGYTTEQLASYRAEFGFFGKFITPLPETYKRLNGGETVTIGGHRWEIISGGGHSPEHTCLYDRNRNLLIAGDQLLPAISPNVSVWPTEPLANPLQDWFDSLHKLRMSISEDVLVLPAHGKPFRGAHFRIDTIIHEHKTRLEVLHDTCAQPRRAVDVFAALYNTRIGSKNLIMATGEALSHLNFLVAAEELVSEHRDGALWYRRC